eukprot:11211095-Lingulodinium_polyedra.AAC.1
MVSYCWPNAGRVSAAELPTHFTTTMASTSGSRQTNHWRRAGRTRLRLANNSSVTRWSSAWKKWPYPT